MAVSAGTMLSSSGKAIVAPSPRNTVRRSRCILLMNMSAPRLRSTHLKRLAPDDPEDQRRPAVAVLAHVAHQLAHGRLIEVLDAAPQRVGQQLLGDRVHD